MRNSNKPFLVLSLAIIIPLAGILLSCRVMQISENDGGGHWNPPRQVIIDAKIARAEYAVNMSLMSWISKANQKNQLIALLRDKDPVFLAFSEMEDILVPYYWDDGAVISLECDYYGFLFKGRRILIYLSKGSTGLKWVMNSDSKEISDLRLCALEGQIDEIGSSLFEVLGKIARIKPNMAWMVNGTDALSHVLDFFDPRWLYIAGDAMLNADDVSRIAGEPNLNYLWINVKSINKKMPFLPLKTLRTLVIKNWNPEETGPLPANLKSLRSLTILHSPIKNLSGISALRGLDELHLISCTKLTDVNALSGMPLLKGLTFTDCKNLSNLKSVKNLKKLQWFGPPPGTSQSQFDEIISSHKDLRVLELIKCKNIKDMTAIGSLKQLESLILLDGRMDYAPLHNLKGLRLLALPKAAFRDKGDVEAIQKAQPGCLILEAEPFCLGSGWILMLWPALLFMFLLNHKRIKKDPR